MTNANLAILLIAAALAACSNISPAGLLAAARLSPLDTPPGDISVAVSVPDALRLSEGDAQLFLGFAPEAPDVEPVAVTVDLSVDAGAQAPRPPKPGETIYVLGIGADAAERLSQAQQRIKALKAADVPGTGTLSVAVSGGCLTSEPPGGLPVSTWLRTSPGADFVALTREVDLLEMVPENAEVDLRMC